MGSMRGFDALGPTKQGLQNTVNREEVLKMICPPHATRPREIRLRVGRDKSGRYRFFERHVESDDIRMWTPGLELSTTQFHKLRRMLEAKELRTENGPYGCFLFYHVHENIAA